MLRMAEATSRGLRVRLAILIGAAALGIVLNRFVQDHLATLQVLAASDPLAARARLAMEMRAGGVGLFALTTALGVAIVIASRRARQLLCFPPPGLWSWGSARTVTGSAARRYAGVGFVLGAVLIACSLAGGVLTWEMGTRLLACRAGVATTR
jgi:hypothetical protein